jgi:hypothetical protein
MSLHLKHPNRSLSLLGAALLLVTAAAGSRAEDRPPYSALAEGLEPTAYLEFGEELDNRCMLLSQGGKLVWMRNRHPSMAVRFRLIRMYSGAPQAGRVVGVLPPGAEGTKLGCNLVTNREQHWEVERASLEPWTPPAPETTEEAPATGSAGNP